MVISSCCLRIPAALMESGNFKQHESTITVRYPFLEPYYQIHSHQIPGIVLEQIRRIAFQIPALV